MTKALSPAIKAFRVRERAKALRAYLLRRERLWRRAHYWQSRANKVHRERERAKIREDYLLSALCGHKKWVEANLAVLRGRSGHGLRGKLRLLRQFDGLRGREEKALYQFLYSHSKKTARFRRLGRELRALDALVDIQGPEPGTPLAVDTIAFPSALEKCENDLRKTTSSRSGDVAAMVSEESLGGA